MWTVDAGIGNAQPTWIIIKLFDFEAACKRSAMKLVRKD